MIMNYCYYYCCYYCLCYCLSLISYYCHYYYCLCVIDLRREGAGLRGGDASHHTPKLLSAERCGRLTPGDMYSMSGQNPSPQRDEFQRNSLFLEFGTRTARGATNKQTSTLSMKSCAQGAMQRRGRL